MRTLLGMQYGGNVPQQYPRQQIPPQQFQEGGGVSSGLAFLKRGKKRKKAYDEARKTEGRLGRKMGKGRTWGSLLGLGGGLLGAAALGALGIGTGGLGLALAAGLGTAAGKYGGSRLGYGKDLKTKDIMYGEEAGIEDIAEAGESYRGQMGQEALLSGAKAGLMAGFAPGGSMYGKTARGAEGLVKGANIAGATDVALQSSLGLSAPPTLGTAPVPGAPGSLTTGALAGTKTGLDVIPETLGEVPSVPSGASLSGDRLNLELAKVWKGVGETQQATADQWGRILDSPYYKEVMGGAGELVPEIATEAADTLGAYTGTAAQNRELLGAGGYGGTSIVDALNRAGLGSSFQERAGMYENIYGSPQIAGLMGGGTVQQTPRTLLSLIG